ncbi:MAG: alpha-hydroxy-acid oxidizing protein [Alphaproteobacteria bacterium]|nr:alpha-hydroxy-acid oxidizing protein [Alphaproteobacteria bacterium]
MTSRSFHSCEEARSRARRRLPRLVFDFVDGAAGGEIAAAENLAAFARIKLGPRVLVEVRDRSLATRLLGRGMGLPFGIAPMGMCNLTWPGADRMLAAESVRRDIPLCVSTAASTSLEAMHDATGGRAWFQLYVTGSQDAALSLVERAAAAGYEVLVLTVDVPVVAPRPRDRRNGFETPFRMRPRQFVDFALHPRWSLSTLAAGIPRFGNFTEGTGTKGFDRNASRAGANWSFLETLRSRWKGRLVVKGVMHPDDARRIKSAGADAIYVSNHGGRQLDAAPPAIDVLPAIRNAVGPDYRLIIDSGVRSGGDVVKAIARGADFVMIGRAALYAIGADGARGLATLLDLFAEEIGVVLAQLGLGRVDELGPAVPYDTKETPRS